MSSKLTVVSWNINGIGYLKTERANREPTRTTINEQLSNSIIHKYNPDLILFQEVVAYENEGGKHEEIIDMAQFENNYHYISSHVIDTKRNNHPSKWDIIRKKGGWGSNDYLAQGSAIMWKRNLMHCSLWQSDAKDSSRSQYLKQEEIRLDTGLYTGDRDSEPRIATVSRFIIHNRDIFIVNLHLTTLVGEREGLPERNEAGSKLRLRQLDIIFNGIVSRYNQWRENHDVLRKKPKPLWLLIGDFNGTDTSPEIQKLKRMRFQDLCPAKEVIGKGKGTKRKKTDNKPSITLDYIFGGLEYYAFDPYEMSDNLDKIPPEYDIKTSDHFPIIARFPL